MLRLTCLVFLFFAVNVGAQPAAILHKPFAEQYYFVDSVQTAVNQSTQKDKTLQLKTLIGWAEEKGDKDLATALKLKLFYFNYSGKIGSDNQDEKFALSLKQKNKNEYIQATILQDLGTYYINEHNKNSLAFEYFLLAYNLYKGFSPEEFPPKQIYIYELGGSYFRYGDYSTAARYLSEALGINKSRITDITTTTYNTIGICYQRMKKYDSAEFYLRLAYNKAINEKDSTWIGIASGNIGMTYFLQNKYTEAKPLLQNDISLSLSHGQIHNAVGSMTLLANIYLAENAIGKAEELLMEAKKYSWRRNYWHDFELAQKIYGTLGKLYASKNNMQLAYLYADSAMNAKDSAMAHVLATNLDKAQERTDYVQRKYEAGKVESEKREQALIRNSLIVGMLLLMTIGILAINRQRLKQKKLEAEKKNAEAELDAAAARLVSFRQRVEEKDEIIGHFNEELERLKKEEEILEDTDVRTQLENAMLVTDEQWDEFRKLFEKVHKGFFANLKGKLPDLTPAEVRFLALTKLNLSSKEMAAMLGISQNAIRIYRYRLRRKLNLDKDDMLEELVKSI